MLAVVVIQLETTRHIPRLKPHLPAKNLEDLFSGATILVLTQLASDVPELVEDVRVGTVERGEAAVLYVTGSGSSLSPVWVKRPVSTR